MNTEITLEEMKSMLDELPAFMMKKIVSLLSEHKKDNMPVPQGLLNWPVFN